MSRKSLLVTWILTSWVLGGLLFVAAGLIWLLATDNSSTIGYAFIAIGVIFVGVGGIHSRGAGQR